jgi:HPt (histidine-containing phosphotransfer) domain-containing protein
MTRNMLQCDTNALVNDLRHSEGFAIMQHQTKLSEQGVTSLFHEPDFAVQLREDLPLADVRHVLGLFAGDMQRLTASLHTAAATGQAQAMRRAAHALAGAAGAVGASMLEQACRRAMTSAPDDATELLIRVAAIEAASAAAEVALERVNAELVRETAEPAHGRA